MLNDDESYFAKEESVWHAFVEAITLSLRDYDDVYADATHLGPSSRKKLLKAINAKGYANLNVNVIYFILMFLLKFVLSAINSVMVERKFQKK